jgi:uncharacterized iron-regulated membrane protein
MLRAKSLRQLLLALHLHLGLWLGMLFALLGITGSALVFYLEIDRVLNPSIKVLSAPVEQRSFDAVYQALKEAEPSRGGAWRIERPLTESTPIMARYYDPVETMGQKFAPLMLSLDPNTLEVTSGRFWGDYAVTWLYDLHYTLLLGVTGHNAVGVLGVLLTTSLLTGLYMWWPSVKRWRRAIRPTVRSSTVLRTYDVHVLSGVYGGLVMLVIAITGVMLAFPNATVFLINLASPVAQSQPVVRGLHLDKSKMLSLDEAVRIAQARYPSAEVRWVETSGEDGRPISIRLYQAGEPGRRFPKTYVWVHPLTGAVLYEQDPVTESLGAKALSWIHPLHNGEAFGLFGRLLACVVGLLPAVLLVTGVLRWRQKLRAKWRTKFLEKSLNEAI